MGAEGYGHDFGDMPERPVGIGRQILRTPKRYYRRRPQFWLGVAVGAFGISAGAVQVVGGFFEGTKQTVEAGKENYSNSDVSMPDAQICIGDFGIGCDETDDGTGTARPGDASPTTTVSDRYEAQVPADTTASASGELPETVRVPADPKMAGVGNILRLCTGGAEPDWLHLAEQWAPMAAANGLSADVNAPGYIAGDELICVVG